MNRAIYLSFPIVILCLWVVSNGETRDDTILFSSWNFIPLDYDASWAAVLASYILWSGIRFL